MKRQVSLLVSLLMVGAANTSLASDDYDCYKPDWSIWLTGKVAESGSIEYFVHGMDVYVDNERIRQIENEEFEPGSSPHDFEYLSDDLTIVMNWYDETLEFDWHNPETGEVVHYQGVVICE